MKRLLDIAGGLILLIPIGITVMFLAILVLLVNRYRPFFLQKRPGKDGKVFTCMKINTLRPPKDESEINDKEQDKLRATRFGTWLRNRGLDELPQVWNILIGQMSFVGPRPLLEKNYAKILAENPAIKTDIMAWRDARLKVCPGLSGWHQIHSLGSRIIHYDTEYLSNPTLIKQMKVIFASIWIMIIGKQRYFN